MGEAAPLITPNWHILSVCTRSQQAVRRELDAWSFCSFSKIIMPRPYLESLGTSSFVDVCVYCFSYKSNSLCMFVYVFAVLLFRFYYSLNFNSFWSTVSFKLARPSIFLTLQMSLSPIKSTSFFLILIFLKSWKSIKSRNFWKSSWTSLKSHWKILKIY